MKQFEIFRYLKKWRYLIAVIMLIGGVLFYFYATGKQSYTASVAIRYTNPEAATGQFPGGKTLDAMEIISSRVINGVITDLGLNSSLEGIRSNCDVTEIIPEDQELLRAALLDKGEEYVYYPTDYAIQYTASANASQEYARRVVNAILEHYFTCYAEDYLNDNQPANNAPNVVNPAYDYIEQADMLDESIAEIMAYLEAKLVLFPSYRAAATGYSFQDLHDIYEYLYNNALPYLYARVIEHGVTKNASVMTHKYTQTISKDALQKQSNAEKLSLIDRVIEEYAAKLRENSTAQSVGVDGAIDNGKTVLQNVYDYDHPEEVDRSITYDTLIYSRIDYQLQMKMMDIYQNRNKDLLEVFQNKASVTDASLDAEIAKLVDTLNRVYATMDQTCNEFNQYRASSYISVLTNINAYANLNVRLYLILTIAVFFVGGCVGSIVLGRGQDIMEYIIYNDKNTGLPNRATCDREIEKYGGTVLPDNFCCVLISLDNLRLINENEGYNKGNTMLRQLALIIKEVSTGLGFVGYNNAGQYMCLFTDCTPERVEAMRDGLLTMVARYNKENELVPLKVRCAYTCTTSSHVFDIKQLVRNTVQNLRETV